VKIRAFNDVGMDFAGPFEIKQGRGKPKKKIYILVLTCMSTRAVHLEATGGMDTTHVINALSRFTDTRGIPESIVSDNQTSFIKAEKDLAEWIESIDFEKVQRELGKLPHLDKPIRWDFNPPYGSHFGGVFEIVVKAAKRALKSIAGVSDLTEEEFRTFVSKAAWMLNQRPIQKVGDSGDLQALTPNHFLVGGVDAVFPPDYEKGKVDLTERLKFQDEVQKHFWSRFHQEIVPLLAPRSKWFHECGNLKEGDIVLESDEATPRGYWRKMRIVRVIPSTDGFIRRVELTNGQGKQYMRPITKLLPLML
jgi:hypothetical protein